jgi:hypothetical protein
LRDPTARDSSARLASTRPSEAGDAPSGRERFVQNPQLPKSFVERNARGVRQVERTDGSKSGDADHALGVEREKGLGEADALPPENEGIAGRVRHFQVTDHRRGTEEVQAARRAFVGPNFQERVEIRVRSNIDQMPVVHAGALDAVRVDPEAELPDEVQRRRGRRAQARDVARVRRDLRFDERDVKRWRKGLRTETHGQPVARRVVLLGLRRGTK